ncbi:MAG TPA: FmdB family zinc ribbon protein [Mycobacteriales bacterium]|nr:FmdB family zinc ribbon protein [Mycobacteriales bacterium]
MPTYQYACTACGEALEAVQGFHDPPLEECPSCTGRLRKVFSSVGVVFKGSGFYRNDSRDAAKGESKTDAGKSEAAKGGDGASSTAPKTDAAASTSTSSDGGKSASPKSTDSGATAPASTAPSSS